MDCWNQSRPVTTTRYDLQRPCPHLGIHFVNEVLLHVVNNRPAIQGVKTIEPSNPNHPKPERYPTKTNTWHFAWSPHRPSTNMESWTNSARVQGPHLAWLFAIPLSLNAKRTETCRRCFEDLQVLRGLQSPVSTCSHRRIRHILWIFNLCISFCRKYTSIDLG